MSDKIDDHVAQGATAADVGAFSRAETKGGRPRDPLVVLDGLEPHPPPEVLRGRLKALREVLNGADPLDRAVLRDALTRRLEALKVRAPAALADAALAADQAQDLQGRRLELADPEPWFEPVEGAVLLEEIVRVLERFVVLPKGAAVAIALWVVHAHAHGAAEVSPILAVTSPLKRCGKTTLFTILSTLVPRPLSTSNISPASLFRTVDKYEPTLLIDEADTFITLSDETRGILNAAHTRSAAWVVRTVGDEHEPRQFSTWCPKAVALVGKLPDTLGDRSIVIPMRRKTKAEKVKRLRLNRLPPELDTLRQKAARWTRDHLARFRVADPAIPGELDDRAADNWEPLLAIADLAGGEWPARARSAALLFSGGDRRIEDSVGIQLLGDIRAIFDQREVDQLPSTQLVEALANLDERPWREWGKRAKPITPTQLAAILKPFEIFSKDIRLSGDVILKGYKREQFGEAFSRYLPAPVPPPDDWGEV